MKRGNQSKARQRVNNGVSRHLPAAIPSIAQACGRVKRKISDDQVSVGLPEERGIGFFTHAILVSGQGFL